MSGANSIWRFANPTVFMNISGRVLPILWIGSLITLATGLVWGFFFIPDDFRMKATVKLFYVHVPSAMMAINMWFMMLIASLIWVIRRHHISALAAKAAAPVGIVMTLIALLTGAIWGQPMWGSAWEWDPRLTSFLVLFCFYLGYIALWNAIEDPDTAADLTSILCLVGSVFAVLSRYAILFWNQSLHQGASLSLDAEENVADVYWIPALVCLVGFTLLCVTLVIFRTRTEIEARKLFSRQLRERLA